VGRTKTIDDDEILRHARAVFRKAGPAASTRDVARAAGISQAVLYQRFGSKEEMFLRAATPKPPDVDSLLGPYPPPDAWADLVRIGERIAAYLRTLMPTLLQVVAQPDLGHARLLELHRGLAFHPLVDGLIARFARLQSDTLVGGDNPATSARAFLAVVHSAVFFEFMTHGKATARHASTLEALVRVLWEGIAPSKGRATPQKRPERKKR
jgi:AcrR family transcriptional regulator